MQARWTPRFTLVSIFLTTTFVAAVALGTATWVGLQSDGSVLIPTGQRLTPAGVHIEVNDRPLGMKLSPAGDLLAVVTGSNFNPRALHIIDAAARTLKQTIAIGDSFVGVDFSPDGRTLYVGGGRNNDVKIFTMAPAGTFAAAGSIPIPESAPSGLDVNANGSRLYVALNMRHSVAVIDTAARKLVTEVPVGIYPYTTVLSADGSKVYVSNWGGKVPGPTDFTDGMFPVVVDRRTGIPVSGTVSVIETATNTVSRTIDVGLHPSGMTLSPAGDRVYVTNANSDTVSVIDTATDTVIKTLSVQLSQESAGHRAAPILGSSPNAVAASPDGRRLYVANAAENAIAVLDPQRNTDNAVLGLIPTGWYPTALAVSMNGGQLYIASGYGFGSIAPVPSGQGRSYADRLGVISILDVPGPGQLQQLTVAVRSNNRSLPPDDVAIGQGSSPIPMHPGQRSPIKHVFYIIKENRTYDQVFGALPQGNGDPSLVEFGRNVTPNHHALAEQYVLLDNFYGPGDQSALGHRWNLQAYPSTWTHKYGNARNNQSPMLLGPTEAIYDNAKAHGLRVRSYGERGLNTFTPANATWTDIYNDWKNGTHNVSIVPQAIIVGLRDIYHPTYPAYEMRVTEQYRADIFLKEFAEFEKNGNLPNLVILLLPQDHTEGTSPGYPTPRATVADNDLALGRIVEAISKSRYWKESAIFVTEDDSQDGVDHVDGHRTVGLVIGPHVRRGAVDSTFYTIINMYRTMEQILGLPPLNQFDLAAQPMFSVFASTPDFTPYTALANQIPLDEMNPSLAGLTGLQRQLAEFSLTIERSEPDASDADMLNRAIWHSVKGFDTPYNHGRPLASQHSSFVSLLQLAGQ
jgi:YVTN family beta-propeller protein